MSPLLLVLCGLLGFRISTPLCAPDLSRLASLSPLPELSAHPTMFSSLEALTDDAIESPPAHISTRPGAFRPKAQPRGSKGAPVSARRQSSLPAISSKAQDVSSSAIVKSSNETTHVGSAAAVTAQVARDVRFSLETTENFYFGHNLDDAVTGSYYDGNAEGIGTRIMESLQSNNIQEERVLGRDVSGSHILESSGNFLFDENSLFYSSQCTLEDADGREQVDVSNASIVAPLITEERPLECFVQEQYDEEPLVEVEVPFTNDAAQKKKHSGKVDEGSFKECQSKILRESVYKRQIKSKEFAEASQKKVRNQRSTESTPMLKAVGGSVSDNHHKDNSSSTPKDQRRKKISNIAAQDSSSEVPADTLALSNTQESNRRKKRGSVEESMLTISNIDVTVEDVKVKKKSRSYVIRAKRGRRHAINPADPDLDLKKMTMRDVIRLAETKDRLFRKDEAKKINGAAESASTVPVHEEYEERTSFAPQVQIVDGRIVIDQESLTISAHPKDDVRNYRRVEETHSKLNYHSYVKRTARVNWTKEETERFYEALHEFGTNFAIIQQLFPGRTRKQIFLKYKKEEKLCPLRVSEALILKPSEYMRYGEVMNLMNLQPNRTPTEASQRDSLSPEMETLETQSLSTIDVEPILEPHFPNHVEDVKEEGSIVALEHGNLETKTSAESYQAKSDTDVSTCNEKPEEPIVHRKRSLFSYQTSIK